MPCRFALVVGLMAASLATSELQAQTKVYRWIDGMCESTIRYDARKLDPAAVMGTVHVLTADGGSVPIAPHVATPADVAKADPAKFERDCAAAAAKMRAQKLLPLKGIEELQTERANQIDDACAFGGAHLRGHTDPSALRRYAPAAEHCARFIDALEGKADLTDFWWKRVVEGCANNASPEACQKRYRAEGSRPDADAWKKHYLVGFGWGNCATEFTAFNGEGATRREAMTERLGKAFKKTYRVKQKCEEP